MVRLRLGTLITSESIPGRRPLRPHATMHLPAMIVCSIQSMPIEDY